MKGFIKNNIKVVIGIVIGTIITGATVYAATVISGSGVLYDNTSSGLTSTNVQEAIDEIHQKSDIRKQGNFVSAYTYNSSNCVTGEEDTCVKTDCYKNKTANSCKTGDIIKYKVNGTDIVTFHVMYDNGSTLTMQSQRNTIYSTPWINKADYETANTDGTSCSYDSCNDEGPITVLNALETATAGWTNVNSQNYTMGTTSLSNKGEFTGCSSYNSCTKNTYTLESRTARARMITLQEAAAFGCTDDINSCPRWMSNFLLLTNDNNVANGATENWGYWTMNVSANKNSLTNKTYAWYVEFYSNLYSGDPYMLECGARAVVEVSK